MHTYFRTKGSVHMTLPPVNQKVGLTTIPPHVASQEQEWLQWTLGTDGAAIQQGITYVYPPISGEARLLRLAVI